nr:MAG: hypothetical protein DIU80_07140 [Chloroflexota bacterium]
MLHAPAADLWDELQATQEALECSSDEPPVALQHLQRLLRRRRSLALDQALPQLADAGAEIDAIFDVWAQGPH